MAIVYNEKTKIFTISTQHTTYMCGVYLPAILPCL